MSSQLSSDGFLNLPNHSRNFFERSKTLPLKSELFTSEFTIIATSLQIVFSLDSKNEIRVTKNEIVDYV